MDQPYKRKEYYFPRNVINSGKVFNGTLEKRNVFEAVLLFLLGMLICSFFEVSSEKVYSLHVYICGPLFLIGLVGIQGLPVSTYLCSMIIWALHRKPHFYNPHGKAYDKRYADLVISEPQLGNVISDTLGKIKAKYIVQKDYIEGETYKFAQDPAWTYLAQGSTKPLEDEQKKKDGQVLDLSDLMSADYSKKKE